LIDGIDYNVTSKERIELKKMLNSDLIMLVLFGSMLLIDDLFSFIFEKVQLPV
jgi:hypothetical protein